MILYRVVMKQRNKLASLIAAKELSISNRHRYRGPLYTSEDQRADLADLRLLRIKMWDVCRALIDVMHAKNSRASNKVYATFDKMTELLSKSGPDWRRGPLPIVHDFDNRYSNVAARVAHRSVKELLWARRKYMSRARDARSEGNFNDMHEQLELAKRASRARSAYRRSLMRMMPLDCDEPLVQRRVREAEERDEAMREAVRVQRGRSLADDSALPPAPVEQYIK